ncbi:MAG: hypothetical protein ABIA78_01845 [archaeon]
MNIKKNKKAVSIMIGYVLLVTFAVIIGAIVYQWVKTYVPRDSLECPDETSLFIKDYTYNCSTNQLSLTFRNNGRFDIRGYFIHGTTSQEQELATQDLSQSHDKYTVGNSVIFNGIGDNPFKSNSEEAHNFNLSAVGQIYSVEIIPIRWQTQDNKKITLSCGISKIKDTIYCSS